MKIILGVKFMIKEIKIPNLGTTADEMKIVRWLKKEGDKVERGEPLLEVETDKATMEVESFVAGYLKKIVSNTGDTVVTGSIVAYIGNEDDTYVDPSTERVLQLNQIPENKIAEIKSPSKEIKISPMVRKLAEKHGIDINGIVGSGPDGLILKEDIMRFVEADGPAQADAQTESAGQKLEQEIVPFTRVGLAVSNAMTRSKSTIPHVYFSIDIDATAMKKLRSDSGKKISYNSIILYNVAECLKAFPYLAAKYGENGRILAKEINIGLAVAKGDDLFVPVVKRLGSNGMDLDGIQKEIDRLTASVKSGEIKQDDISGGVFTVSNLGAYGLSSFIPVINPPEVAILAVAGVQEKVVVMDGGIRIRSMITMTLSVDHRVVNGAYAADFLKSLKQKLETEIK